MAALGLLKTVSFSKIRNPSSSLSLPSSINFFRAKLVDLATLGVSVNRAFEPLNTTISPVSSKDPLAFALLISSMYNIKKYILLWRV